MLKTFFSRVKSESIDILTGWNSTGFDFPYIINRCKKLGIECFVRKTDVISTQHSIINKKEPTIDIFHNMDKPQKHYYKFKKPETIDYIYCLIPVL